jgi:hypothetical protein
MRIGNALQGKDPSIQSGPEQRYAEESRQATVAREGTNRLRISEAYRRRGEAETARIKAAENEQERADAERKRKLEEQSKIDAEKRKEHGDALSEYNEVSMLPGFQPPSGLNLDTLTMKDIVRMKTDWGVRMRGQSPELANFSPQTIYDMTVLDMAMKKYMGSQQPSSLSVGAEGGLSAGFRQPGGDDQPSVTPTTPLTPTTNRLLARYGISKIRQDGSFMTEAEATETIGRYNTWKPLNATESKDYRDALIIVKMAKELSSIMDYSTEAKPFATSEEESNFRAKATNLRDFVIRERTGAAINADEPQMVKYFTPRLGALSRNQRAALDELINFYSGAASFKEVEKRMPEDQVRALRGSLLGVSMGVQPIRIDENEHDEVK